VYVEEKEGRRKGEGMRERRRRERGKERKREGGKEGRREGGRREGRKDNQERGNNKIRWPQESRACSPRFFQRARRARGFIFPKRFGDVQGF
jgi:hypothetical protein